MILVYGLQIMKLGFYWDDWQMIYLMRQGNLNEIWNFYFYDRPFSTWTLALTGPILKTSPFLWHFFTLGIRWLGVIFFYLAFLSIWPKNKIEVQWISILFAIYPGFSQQAISIAYSQHFLTYMLFTLSLWLMIKGIKRQNGLFNIELIFSYLCTILHMLTMEYFIGLELIRLPILWIILKKEDPNSTPIKVFLKYAAPYIFILAGYTSWRFWIYPSLTFENRNKLLMLSNFTNAPLKTILHFIEIILKDFFHLNIFTWVKAIEPNTIQIQSKTWLAALGIGLITSAFFFMFYHDRKAKTTQETTNQFQRQAAALGISAVLFGGLPVWMTNRQIIIGLYSDRLVLAPQFGVAILTVALISWFLQEKKQVASIALLITFSFMVHIKTDSKFRLNWDLQRQYYNQLIWRAPDLTPGTAILGTKLPFGYSSDYAVAFALNSIYEKEDDVEKVAYWFLDAPRYIGNQLSAFEPGHPIDFTLRTIKFQSTTSQSLAIAYNPAQGCLRVLDSAYANAPDFSIGSEAEYEQALFAISFQDIAISFPDKNTEFAQENFNEIFGKEVDHEWCYYFQKADLMRQFKQWDSVILYMDEAFSQGFYPRTGVEYIPLIEAYAHLGNWDLAGELILEISKKDSKLNPFLLDTLKRLGIETDYSNGYAETFDELDDQLHSNETNP
ncbi:MAG: hypothetical protein JEZ06_19320 [Anaerolineaceae bacterium]|nr:hypothetical protein [Anaerolineaceae bacterium]